LDDETLIDGDTLFRKDWTEPQVSIMDTVVEMREMKIGDRISFKIQGVPLTARISSIRTRDNQSLSPFFYFVFPGSVLAQAPQTLFAAVTVPPGQMGSLQTSVVSRFPNISVIDMSQTIGILARLMARLSRIVRVFSLVQHGGRHPDPGQRRIRHPGRADGGVCLLQDFGRRQTIRLHRFCPGKHVGRAAQQRPGPGNGTSRCMVGVHGEIRYRLSAVSVGVAVNGGGHCGAGGYGGYDRLPIDHGQKTGDLPKGAAKWIKTDHKKVFWPNLCVGAAIQILDILQHACGLKCIPALTLDQNTLFKTVFYLIGCNYEE
jgi:hypothetical protein